jgi:hypothetical protein
MSARELAEWIDFYQEEPFGSEPDFWRAGMVASVIANAQRDPKRKPEAFTPTDFMPVSKSQQKTKDAQPETLRDKFFRVFGGRIQFKERDDDAIRDD